ncbi:MAG: dolichyl-phosphate beta-glucosyltransferase [Thermodesulfobacteriota bacterium]|nr:dolichyl-phosphate beta-glucosyltransferase [Thermodesulfobacteriota bacterium]
MNYEIAIVVPCYNEEKRLNLEAFEQFADNHLEIMFVMVNDGSTDNTGDVIDQLRMRRPLAFSTFHLSRNMGKAEAVRQGMLQALELKPQYVGFLDADLATPLEEIPRLIEVLRNRREVLMVLGSRVRMLGTKIHRSPSRHYLGRFAATLISSVLNLPVYDTQCGAKFLRCTEFSQRIFDRPFECRWLFDVEIIARTLQLLELRDSQEVGNVFVEVPVLKWSEEKDSKITTGSYFRSLVDLVRIAKRYNRLA